MIFRMYSIWTTPYVCGAHISALSEKSKLTLGKVNALPFGWASVVMRVHFGTLDAMQKAQDSNDPIFKALAKRKEDDRITLILIVSTIALGILLVAAAAQW